jgi:hypothetical protein
MGEGEMMDDDKLMALNIRLDTIQMTLNKILEIIGNDKIEDIPESPFLTKEGLYNYKRRKPKEG